MNEAYLQAFGKVVKNLRESQKISRVRFSLMVNVSRPTLISIEKGEQNFEFDTLVKIANGLGVTIGELFSRCDEVLHDEDPSWKIPVLRSKNNRAYALVSLTSQKQPDEPLEDPKDN